MISKELLKECSDLALLEELKKRIEENKLKVSTNIDAREYPKKIIVFMRERTDEKGLFMYLSETKISAEIAYFDSYENSLPELDKLHGSNSKEVSKIDILNYWNIGEDKSSPSEKIKTTARLLLSEKVRKNLMFFHSEKKKKKDKIVFRYYEKGEVRANPDGSEPVYLDNSKADLSKDKFYESEEFDWTEAMSYVMMMVKGDDRFTQSVSKMVSEAVSDIVMKIEKENERQK